MGATYPLVQVVPLHRTIKALPHAIRGMGFSVGQKCKGSFPKPKPPFSGRNHWTYGNEKPIAVKHTPPLTLSSQWLQSRAVKETATPKPKGEAMTTQAPAIAVYVRVSSKQQDTKSQRPDLERWLSAYADGQPVKWYADKFTGRTMERKGWQQLEADIAAGKVSKVLCWRLDRLGRTASGLTKLFDYLTARKVSLVSLKDGLDLATSAGRLMANVLASVAQYETEIRQERVLAGQAVARANGVKWGGSKRGRRISVTHEQVEAVKRYKADGMKTARIARAVGLSRPTIYRLLGEK